jgi:hypothetical protein
MASSRCQKSDGIRTSSRCADASGSLSSQVPQPTVSSARSRAHQTTLFAAMLQSISKSSSPRRLRVFRPDLDPRCQRVSQRHGAWARSIFGWLAAGREAATWNMERGTLNIDPRTLNVERGTFFDAQPSPSQNRTSDMWQTVRYGHSSGGRGRRTRQRPRPWAPSKGPKHSSAVTRHITRLGDSKPLIGEWHTKGGSVSGRSSSIGCPDWPSISEGGRVAIHVPYCLSGQ